MVLLNNLKSQRFQILTLISNQVYSQDFQDFTTLLNVGSPCYAKLQRRIFIINTFCMNDVLNLRTKICIQLCIDKNDHEISRGGHEDTNLFSCFSRNVANQVFLVVISLLQKAITMFSSSQSRLVVNYCSFYERNQKEGSVFTKREHYILINMFFQHQHKRLSMSTLRVSTAENSASAYLQDRFTKARRGCAGARARGKQTATPSRQCRQNHHSIVW